MFVFRCTDINAVPDLRGIGGPDEGAKDSVPAGKNVPIVCVSQGLHIMMMYFVHVRRNDNPAHQVVHPFWERNVRVIKLRKKNRAGLVKKYKPDRGPADQHAKERKQSAENAFSRMMTVCGCRIHPGI